MPSNSPLFAHIHGQIVPLDQAFLHIDDLSIQRGYGVFDFFRVEDGHPYFLDDSIERLHNSARIMALEVPISRSDLRAAIFVLIEKNDLPLSGIKMILTGGYSEDGFEPGVPNLIITQAPTSYPSARSMENGFKIISHEYVREFPRAKTINYSMGIRLLEKMKQHGVDDVLYHQKGVVSEFPRSNFFIVRPDKTVVTPAQDVLHGVTRKNLLAMSGRQYEIIEGTVTLDDVRGAKEAFTTSTIKRATPITFIDGQPIGTGKPGEVTLSLLDALIALEQSERLAAV